MAGEDILGFSNPKHNQMAMEVLWLSAVTNRPGNAGCCYAKAASRASICEFRPSEGFLPNQQNQDQEERSQPRASGEALEGATAATAPAWTNKPTSD